MVVVGSPRVLLNTESHMIKQYGDKGRCWSLYLKSCLEHSTLTIPLMVEADKNVADNFKADLAAYLGATLPNDSRHQSSRANYRTRGTNSRAASNEHVLSGSRIGTQSSQSTDGQRIATHARSGIRLVHKPLSSDENVFKQMSQVESVAPVNTQTATCSVSYSQLAVQKQRPMRSTKNTDANINQPLSSKSAVKQSIQETKMDSAHNSNAASSSKQTLAASLSKPIKLTPSSLLSEPTLGRNVEAPKSRSRGSYMCIDLSAITIKH